MASHKDPRTLTKEKELLEFNLRDTQLKYRKNADELIRVEREEKTLSQKVFSVKRELELLELKKDSFTRNLENLKSEETRLKSELSKLEADINLKDREIKQSEMNSKKA